MKSLEEREIWFLTGSQALYGDDTLRQVAEQSRQIADALNDASGVPIRVVWQPVLTDAEAIRRICLDANTSDACAGVIAWMHTFSPAKMWIAGLDALRTPLLHLHTQANVTLPWSSIDMDFMNLNQAAHGDREFGYIQSRLGVARKTVAGHVSDPSVAERIGAWARAAAGRAELSSLRLARFGDNMRDVAVTEGDKVEAQRRFGVSVNTYGVNDLVAAVDEVADAEVTTLVGEYADTYRVVPELRSGGDRHDSLRYAARIELGLRHFLVSGGFGAFTTNFEDLGGLRQLPGLAVQRLMADGYGFGGEGDWKTSVLLRTLKVMAGGLTGGTSFMEDYTYNLEPGQERILGAHMLEVCPSIAEGVPVVRDPRAGHRRPGGPGQARLRRRARSRGGRGHGGHGGPVPAGRQRDRGGRPHRATAEPPGGPCGVEAAARPAHLDRGVADGGRPASHGALLRGRRRGARRPRRHGRCRAACHRRGYQDPASSPRRSAGTRPTTAWPRASERAPVRPVRAPSPGVLPGAGADLRNRPSSARAITVSGRFPRSGATRAVRIPGPCPAEQPPQVTGVAAGHPSRRLPRCRSSPGLLRDARQDVRRPGEDQVGLHRRCTPAWAGSSRRTGWPGPPAGW